MASEFMPGTLITITGTATGPSFRDFRIEWAEGVWLLDREVRYHGDEVAVAAAESEALAEDALSLVEVDFEPLPFVADATWPPIDICLNIVLSESDAVNALA